ncbi:kinase [Anaeramoeba flamelloides]|uniref:Kinase n=1 Tax=Anaeramoeba flamelloides TaxID=1746091 RepID=A0ABQ8Z284_9EUKA|nr:kinase [Anaeramoeba flamelloides]
MHSESEYETSSSTEEKQVRKKKKHKKNHKKKKLKKKESSRSSTTSTPSSSSPEYENSLIAYKPKNNNNTLNPDWLDLMKGACSYDTDLSSDLSSDESEEFDNWFNPMDYILGQNILKKKKYKKRTKPKNLLIGVSSSTSTTTSVSSSTEISSDTDYGYVSVSISESESETGSESGSENKNKKKKKKKKKHKYRNKPKKEYNLTDVRVHKQHPKVVKLCFLIFLTNKGILNKYLSNLQTYLNNVKQIKHKWWESKYLYVSIVGIVPNPTLKIKSTLKKEFYILKFTNNLKRIQRFLKDLKKHIHKKTIQEIQPRQFWECIETIQDFDWNGSDKRLIQISPKIVGNKKNSTNRQHRTIQVLNHKKIQYFLLNFKKYKDDSMSYIKAIYNSSGNYLLKVYRLCDEDKMIYLCKKIIPYLRIIQRLEKNYKKDKISFKRSKKSYIKKIRKHSNSPYKKTNNNHHHHHHRHHHHHYHHQDKDTERGTSKSKKKSKEKKEKKTKKKRKWETDESYPDKSKKKDIKNNDVQRAPNSSKKFIGKDWSELREATVKYLSPATPLENLLNKDVKDYWRTEKKRFRIAKNSLGHGSFKEVYLMYDESDNKLVAKYFTDKFQTIKQLKEVCKSELIISAIARNIAHNFMNQKNKPFKSVDFIIPFIIDFRDNRNKKQKRKKKKKKKNVNRMYKTKKYYNSKENSIYLLGERYLDNNFTHYCYKRQHQELEVPYSTLYSLCHFSYFFTQKRIMLGDLQGVDHILTDPVVHSSDCEENTTPFNSADFCEEGIEEFFNVHICSRTCRNLKLKKHRLHPSEEQINMQRKRLDVKMKRQTCRYYDYKLVCFNKYCSNLIFIKHQDYSKDRDYYCKECSNKK